MQLLNCSVVFRVETMPLQSYVTSFIGFWSRWELISKRQCLSTKHWMEWLHSTFRRCAFQRPMWLQPVAISCGSCFLSCCSSTDECLSPTWISICSSESMEQFSCWYICQAPSLMTFRKSIKDLFLERCLRVVINTTFIIVILLCYLISLVIQALYKSHNTNVI